MTSTEYVQLVKRYPRVWWEASVTSLRTLKPRLVIMRGYRIREKRKGYWQVIPDTMVDDTLWVRSVDYRSTKKRIIGGLIIAANRLHDCSMD